MNMIGEPVTVKAAWCTGIRDVIAIRHTAAPAETEVVTADHRFYVGEYSTARAAVVAHGHAAVLDTPARSGAPKGVWREIGDAEDVTLLLPRQIAFDLPDELEIDLYDFARRPSRPARHRTEIRDSYELGYVFGTFLGDGDAFLNTNGRSEVGRVSWALGRDEAATVLEILPVKCTNLLQTGLGCSKQT